MKPSHVLTTLGLCCAGVAGGLLANNAFEGGQDRCLPVVSVTGYGSNMRHLAQINAISAWMREVPKPYARYANWHSADHKGMRCERESRHHRFVCLASANPCLEKETGGAKKPEKAKREHAEERLFPQDLFDGADPYNALTSTGMKAGQHRDMF